MPLLDLDLGVFAARHGWSRAVPHELRRQCRNVTLAAAVALLVVGVTVIGLLGLDGDLLLGGWHGAALAFAACESVLAVFGAVWVLGLVQHVDRPYRWTTTLARTSYAAFIVQTPVLLGAAVALRPLDAPAEVKALLVAVISVPAAFAVGGLLGRVARSASRVL